MTPVDLPALALNVSFETGANSAAWLLGVSPFPTTLAEDIDVLTDVSGDLRERLVIASGKNRDLDAFSPARLSAKLDNRARAYDPFNLAGVHVSAGETQIKPGRRVTLTATHPTTAVAYTLFSGVIRDWPLDFHGQHDALAGIMATDLLTELARTASEASTDAGLSGQAVAAILADAGIGAYDIDAGNTTLASATWTSKALEAIRQVERSEQGAFYVERTGVPTFIERHALLQEDRHNRPQAFIGAGPFSGSAQQYLRGLSPAMLLGLGDADGPVVDLSGNGNHGTATISAGARDATALDFGGDGGISFLTATWVSVPAAASINNVFDGGGSVWMLIKPTDSGGGTLGGLIRKGPWWIRFNGTSIDFGHSFSGAAGAQWSAATALPYDGTAYALAVDYNGDADTNNPTLRLVNLTTGATTTYTVGSGLTEAVAPVGTRDTDAAAILEVGREFNPNYYKGVIDDVALFTTAPTAAQHAEYSALARNGISSDPVVFLEDSLEVSYESDLVVNDVNITRTGGAKQNARDEDSINAYGESNLAYTALPLPSDASALIVATYLLGLRKEPAPRIRAVGIAARRSSANMTEVLTRRLMDRVTVAFTPAGGGTIVQQECYVIGIEHEIDVTRDTMLTRYTFAPTANQAAWLLGLGQLGQETGPTATVLTSY